MLSIQLNIPTLCHKVSIHTKWMFCIQFKSVKTTVYATFMWSIWAICFQSKHSFSSLHVDDFIGSNEKHLNSVINTTLEIMPLLYSNWYFHFSVTKTYLSCSSLRCLQAFKYLFYVFFILLLLSTRNFNKQTFIFFLCWLFVSQSFWKIRQDMNTSLNSIGIFNNW